MPSDGQKWRMTVARRWWAYWVLTGLKPPGYNGISREEASEILTPADVEHMRRQVERAKRGL